ncbi:hypothetical protein SpCBS45565_g02328 [Spizellomyces sp. 'palustris']|nr:hypothetical protein SpCBS45565_g02328 [Spizellomyces sp. 'palustris']
MSKEALDTVLALSESFKSPYRLSNPLLRTILSKHPHLTAEAQTHPTSARILVHPSLPAFLTAFLQVKKHHGTRTEQSVYSDITTWQDLVKRLLTCRPLCFYGASDETLLRDMTSPRGSEWIRVGTESQGLIHMKDYLTYEEMGVAALLGISAPVFFVNTGGRYNRGKWSEEGTFESNGIYTALVGARYEVPGKMEWRHTLAYQGQEPLIHPWTMLYDVHPLQEDLACLDPTLYAPISESVALHIPSYIRRIRIPLDNLLLDANDRARARNKRAYVHVVGLGLGVWQICQSQPRWFVQAAAEAIEAYRLPHVGVLNFSWFPENIIECGGVKSGQQFRTDKGNDIRIEFSKRDPAQKLETRDQDMLLVASFAWDANSYVGNEYWMGMLTASGDPAAAACSTIGEVMNPDINPFLLDNIWVSSE